MPGLFTYKSLYHVFFTNKMSFVYSSACNGITSSLSPWISNISGLLKLALWIVFDVSKTPENINNPAKLYLVPSAKVIIPPCEYPERIIFENGSLNFFEVPLTRYLIISLDNSSSRLCFKKSTPFLGLNSNYCIPFSTWEQIYGAFEA